MGEDFENWGMYELKECVKLVCKFDKLCDDVLTMVAYMINNYEVEETVVMSPETVW